MQQQFSEIPQSTKIESVSQENLDNDLYLPQKFRVIQDYFEEFTQQPDEVYSLKIDEILSTNFPIVFFGSKGQGKTTLARKIDELITKENQGKQIKTIFISASNEIQSDFKSIVKQKSFQSNQQQMKNFEDDIKNDQIRLVTIIDDFDVILLEKQKLLQNIQESMWKMKCKFIYLANSSIRKHEVYHNWVQLEDGLSQYEIMQLNKMDVENYFEQYIPYKQCLLNINLSQNMNNNLLKTIVQRIQDKYIFHNVLIKIIKLSSIVDNMEQEAGNAMMLLKELRVIIKNQDFSFIRMKNSSFAFVSFHKCNFQGSKMENVDISRCWFISCNLNYVLWKNMIKNEVQCYISSIFQNKKIESIVFTNDDQIFAVVFSNSRIEMWHVKTCKRMAVIRNDSNRNNYDSTFFFRTTFSYNGMLLAFNVSQTQIKIQSSQIRKILRKINLQLSNYKVQPIIFSPNNEILALGINEVIYLWDIKRGKEFLQFKEHKVNITELKFSNDDQTLASCCCMMICIWNINTKKLKLKQISKENLNINSFSPDLKYLASNDQWGNVIIVSNLISQVEIKKYLRNDLAHSDAKIITILFSPTSTKEIIFHYPFHHQLVANNQNFNFSSTQNYCQRIIDSIHLVSKYFVLILNSEINYLLQLNHLFKKRIIMID